MIDYLTMCDTKGCRSIPASCNIFHTKCFSDSREKRGTSQEKQDVSREKQDSYLEKRDASCEKQDEGMVAYI